MRFHEGVVRGFRALAGYAIRQPRRVLVAAALVTLAAMPGLARLQLRTDGHALVSRDAPEVRFDQAIRDDFGITDEIVVLIRSAHPDGIYNAATVQLVRDLTADFARLPGLRPVDVASLATEPGLHLKPGTLVPEKLLEPPLQTPAELERLRADVQRIELYTGTLVSFDGTATAILVGVPSEGDRTHWYRLVQEAVAARDYEGHDVSVTGAPVAEALLGIHILEDLGVPRAWLGTSTRSHTELVQWAYPKSLHELRLLVARRIGLVPVAVGVMVLVFLLTFRNPLAALLPLPEVAASLVFVFGLMGYTGVPIYLTVAVMPVLLTAMCVTDEIHVFSRYFTLLREQPKASRAELVGQTMDEMCRPVANTTLTTAIGFVSFAFSPLGPVQAFGIFTALGVLFSLVWSIAVIPAMLMLIKPEVLVRGRGRESGREALCGAAAFARLAGIVVRHRGWVVGLVAGVVALTPLGLRRLIVQDSWIEGFDPGSEFRRATRLVNAQFHGMHLLFVCVDARRDLSVEVLPSAFDNGRFLVPAHVVRDPEELAGSPLLVTAEGLPGSAGREWRSHIEMVLREGTNLALRVPLDAPVVKQQAELARAARLRLELVPRTQLRPEAVRQMADLAAFIRERRDCAVGGVLGPGEYLSTTRVILRPRDPQARVLPQNAGETKSLWDYYRIARGPERLRQVVDPNSSRALLTVFLKGGNFRDTDRLLGAIRAYEQQHLAREGIRLGFAGDVAVSQSLITSIVRTQLRSLGWSLAGIYLCTALLGRSWRWGLYCVLPSTLAVLINFAVMGGVGIPLGVATSMFAGMTLGIGVDFAIHALEGHRQARMARAGATEALAAALSRTGPAVLVNTLSICLGFGVLLFSQVPANARLALLVVLGLGNSLIATLLVLPALLSRWPLNVSRAPTGEIEVDRR